MTRPKVPDDKRIRTAQACEFCKRRKQKCNGLKPCNTCTKRNLVCHYIPNHGHGHDLHSSTQNGSRGEIVDLSSSPMRRTSSPPDTIESGEEPAPKRLRFANHFQQTTEITEPSRLFGTSTPNRQPSMLGQAVGEANPETRPRQSTTSGVEETAEVYTETRMLQDPTGRLLYLGDSATLSYLQYIRMIVESVAGPSQFTLDPSRHRFMELTMSIPPDTQTSVLLPDRRTADALIRSYLTNTNALIEVFDRKAFFRQLDVCYDDPLAADPTFLCWLYLVFAIGLVLATPVPGSEDDDIIKKLHVGQVDRADLFFRNAKGLCDPTTGFEDADFWSVQALLLIAVYMLAKTKRNAAYAYHGMAVRSAYALGLHRQETMVIFPVSVRVVRRNVWRSLYVLDRFLAAALGRPMSICEEDCSVEALITPEKFVGHDKYLADTNNDAASSGGLNAAVRSCQVIGIILKKIYARRKVSTKLAQDISEQCKGSPQNYHFSLHWRQAMNKSIQPALGMAVLHVNLLYCHAVILLTRPFFLFLMNRMQQEKTGAACPVIQTGSKIGKFSEACVNAAYHSITLVHMGLEGKYLPQRDPFIIHFLFAAALVVQSNEFASIHENPAYSDTYQKALSVVTYCTKTDPQAGRIGYILTTFHTVIVSRAQNGPSMMTSSWRNPTSLPNTPPGKLDNDTPDPMENFFLLPTTTTAMTSNPSSTLFNSGSVQPQQQQMQPPGPASRRTLAKTAGPLPSPDWVPAARTPTVSADGDTLVEAEWVHFDTLWENWTTPTTAPAVAAASSAVMEDAAMSQQQYTGECRNIGL